MPVLGVGESYFCTDTKQWFTGSSSGNFLVGPFPVYDITGVLQSGTHVVKGSVTTTSKTVASVVTLSGAAVFSSASSYVVLTKSNAGHITLTQTSGSSFSILTGAVGDVVNYVCIGN